MVERFISNAEAELVRSTFAGLYSLDRRDYSDGQAGLDAVLQAFYADPEVR